MLNKGKKRTTRVDQASPISDKDVTRRQIETKNRRLNQDGRTKVAQENLASHPLFQNRTLDSVDNHPALDQTNTTNDSFGPTSLYAESNDSAQSEHSTSEHINLNEIEMIVQSTPLDVINEEEPEEEFIAEINLPSDVTPTKNVEPTRKSGRVAKKPASFKDSVLTTIKSRSKLLLKKSGVVANPQIVIDPVTATKRLKGIGKKIESAQEGPEAYKEDDEIQNEEDVSEKSESEDSTSSTEDEDDEEETKGSKEKKVKKDKKKDRKDRKDKKSKKDKKKKKGKDKHKKKGKDKKHNKSKEEEKKTRKRKVDELTVPLGDPLLKQPSLNKVFAGLIGDTITSERSPHTTEGSDQPKKKKRKREVENLRVSSSWRMETPVLESNDAEGILSGSLETKEKKSKRKRTPQEAEAHADSKKRKLETGVTTHDTLKKAWNVSCHYCRVSQNNKKQVSHNVFYVNCTGCQNTFCKPCIEGPIGLNFDETIKLVNWLCQCCTRDCCCFFDAGECPREDKHGHCFTYKLKVKKEQTAPKVDPVEVPLPVPVTKTHYTPVLKLKDSGSQKKKKRTDHTFVPKVSNPKAEFREGSSEEDGFESQPVNKKEKGERKVYSKKHKVNDSEDDEFERPVNKKEKGDRHRALYPKKQKENSFDEVYKKRTKDERDADEELRNGKSLSSAYSNIAVSPSRPRARAKTKKLMQAEDDQAQRKQRSIEKKLTTEEEGDIALELVSFQDQISYYIDSIQAEIKACDLALNHLPKKEPNPLEFTYICNLGNMKRNSRLYDDESSEISDFSDSALSSWTDSLVDSFEESDFEVQIEVPANTTIKV